ncbi:MAG TPA: peptidyl-tRNA hydrolase Pth2 [Candidatus Methanomethylicus sp.]|nr:peptidyl-tRNA hydrolase Pth2 [Candidatus Methanomethylicus sp.]
MDFRYKQAIVVRTDLQMSKGKTAVQVAHAAVSSFLRTRSENPEWAAEWLRDGQKKVVLKVPSLDGLLEVERKAARERLPAALISDAGMTELEPGTVTCLGIGPAANSDIDRVTGDLKLL